MKITISATHQYTELQMMQGAQKVRKIIDSISFSDGSVEVATKGAAINYNQGETVLNLGVVAKSPSIFFVGEKTVSEIKATLLKGKIPVKRVAVTLNKSLKLLLVFKESDADKFFNQF